MSERVLKRNSQSHSESQPLTSLQFQISKRICAKQTSSSAFELFDFVGQPFACVGKTDLERFLPATSSCAREVRLAFRFGHKGLRKALLGAETP